MQVVLDVRKNCNAFIFWVLLCKPSLGLLEPSILHKLIISELIDLCASAACAVARKNNFWLCVV